MVLGPLEYIVIGFDQQRFDGSIAREIQKVVERGIIRLVDVVYIGRDQEGNSTIVELDNKDDPRFEAFAPLLTDRMGLFTHEDLDEIVETLPLGTAALALLFEHRWAEEVRAAIGEAGGFLVTRVVIPPEVLAEVNEAVEAKEAELAAFPANEAEAEPVLA